MIEKKLTKRKLYRKFRMFFGARSFVLHHDNNTTSYCLVSVDQTGKLVQALLELGFEEEKIIEEGIYESNAT